MTFRILFAYTATLLLLTSCYKEKYVHEYGPKVAPGTIPYSLGQIIKFENGLNDTITFRCTKYQSIELVAQGECLNEEKNCTRIYHHNGLLVDLETLDRSRTFNLSAYSGSSGVSGRYWTDPNGDPNVGKFLFGSYPNTVWYDSIKLNGKTFYNYQDYPSIRIMASEPGTPTYRDNVIFSKSEGVIMFSAEKKSGNVVLSEERWVLVK